jgi:hypothetical protein
MVMSTAFEFDLVFALPENAPREGDLLDALFRVGLDDAVVGTGTSGLLSLAFVRGGEDAEAVISAAVAAAVVALPAGAQLREVKPDLVSLADVAARLGVTRQALQKRRMPPPSLGGLYRVTEIQPFLESQPGPVRSAAAAAQGWFMAAPAAQRINARLSQDPSVQVG